MIHDFSGTTWNCCIKTLWRESKKHHHKNEGSFSIPMGQWNNKTRVPGKQNCFKSMMEWPNQTNIKQNNSPTKTSPTNLPKQTTIFIQDLWWTRRGVWCQAWPFADATIGVPWMLKVLPKNGSVVLCCSWKCVLAKNNIELLKQLWHLKVFSKKTVAVPRCKTRKRSAAGDTNCLRRHKTSLGIFDHFKGQIHHFAPKQYGVYWPNSFKFSNTETRWDVCWSQTDAQPLSTGSCPEVSWISVKHASQSYVETANFRVSQADREYPKFQTVGSSTMGGGSVPTIAN